MNKLIIALKKQSKTINELKNTRFDVYFGLGKSKILAFDHGGFLYPDGYTDTQNKISDGYYKSIQDFDNTHTADIEFAGDYNGKNQQKYKAETKKISLT